MGHVGIIVNDLSAAKAFFLDFGLTCKGKEIRKESGWITPDFSIRGQVTQVSEQQRAFRRIVSAATERSMYNNAFDSLDQLEAFLGRVGYKAVVSSPLGEVPEPVSIRVLGLPSSLLAPLRSSLRLWVLVPA